jgi:rubredoxin
VPRGHHTEYDPGRRVDDRSHYARSQYVFNAGAEQVPPFEEPYDEHEATVGCPTCGAGRTVTVTHPSDQFYCRDCGDRMTGRMTG